MKQPFKNTYQKLKLPKNYTNKKKAGIGVQPQNLKIKGWALARPFLFFFRKLVPTCKSCAIPLPP